jgi:hypothetical protein
VYAAGPRARIAVIGQAPDRKAQESNTAWNDASGVKLFEWLGVTEQQFRDPDLFAVNGNQMASTRPVAAMKLSRVRPPAPGDAKSSAAGMPTRLTHRSCASGPASSVTSVRNARPRFVSAAQSGSVRSKDRAT